MRVATRRLRSTLKTFKRSFPADRVDHLKDELKWLAGELGEVRDGQVLEHKLLGGVEHEGPEFESVADRIREHLDAKIKNGRRALAQDLDGTRYLRLLDAIDELVGPDDRGEPKPPKRARKALDKADRLLDEATLAGTTSRCTRRARPTSRPGTRSRCSCRATASPPRSSSTS